jgi:hypothetical protein
MAKIYSTSNHVFVDLYFNDMHCLKATFEFITKNVQKHKNNLEILNKVQKEMTDIT